LPLILWLSNKNKIDYVNEQGKNILNFQIVYSIATFILIFFAAFGKITHFKMILSFEILLLIVALLGTIVFFFPIINAIRISKGRVKNFIQQLFDLSNKKPLLIKSKKEDNL